MEINEQKLQKSNQVASIYNVALPSQDDVWICGRVFSESADSNKLNENNVMLQGSYVCSNSQSISLNLASCDEFSLFPGQIVLVNGRNPDGKRFICKQIVEPGLLVPLTSTPSTNSTIHTIQVKLEPSENLTVMAAAGPFMTHGGVQVTNLNLLIDMAKAKNVHALILVKQQI